MAGCPACNTTLPENAAFCAQCGHRATPPSPLARAAPLAVAIAAAAPPSPNAMHVCGRCGTIAPLEGVACTTCDAPFPTHAFAEPRPDGVMFAEVIESDFQCRSCGLRSNLGTFCFEDEVDCSRCGTTQAFDVSQWEQALTHAHAVADLSGPPPGGQGSIRHGQPLQGDNPYRSLGIRHTFAELTQTGMTIGAAGTSHRTLRVKVATGHPVCPNGHGPVVVSLDGATATRAACSVCRDAATYATPTRATELHHSLAGVIDDEHRTDRPRVRVESTAGAIALACPRCNASLPATEVTSVVTCPFCSAASYLPKRALAKLDPQHKSRPFWLLFRGPSALRLGRDGNSDDEPASTSPTPPVNPALPAAVVAPAPSLSTAPAAQKRRFPVAVVVVAAAFCVFAAIVVAVLVFHSPPPAPKPPSAPHGGPHRPHR